MTDLPPKAQAVIDAARCIKHWHDTLYNPKTGECEGMVVSACHVRTLWAALADFDETHPSNKQAAI